MSLGQNGALNGFVPSAGDAWHQDVTQLPTDPSSDVILLQNYNDLAGSYLHPDFSSVLGGNYGIPYTVVDSTKVANIPVAINLYGSESDISVAPIPPGASIEGSPGDCETPDTDRHMIVLDRASCVAYEYWQASSCKSTWSASNVALWDFTKVEQRPFGFTSADAAGLSIFEGLLRYDEIAAGYINHALRFTAQHTKNDQSNGYFVAPATHASGTLWGTDNVMGMRIRLKSDFDISGFSPVNQIILKAMKQYGMILADNGSNMFFQGTSDSRWNDDDLANLKAIPVSAFDVLKMGTVYDAITAPTGIPPQVASFTASQTSIRLGDAVTLTSNVMNSSYSYIDNAGFTRGALAVSPAATTTYTLTSRNAFGSAVASVTVKVQKPLVVPSLTIPGIPTQILGASAFAPTAHSNSPGAIVFSVLSGPAKIVGSMLSTTGIGQVTIQATQAAASDATNDYAGAVAQFTFQVVAPLQLATLLVSGVPSPIAQGAQSYVTVSALDASGRVISNYTGFIIMLTTDYYSTMPSTYTFQASDAGVHTFPIKFTTPGTQTIYAAGSSVMGMEDAIRVVAATK